MKRTRKGFTLVELLIVVAIVGVLASMMTISAGSSTATAKAAAIYNNIRSIKMAGMMYQVQQGDGFKESNLTKDNLEEAKLLKLDNYNKNSAGETGNIEYKIKPGVGATDSAAAVGAYVICQFKDDADRVAIAKALKGYKDIRVEGDEDEDTTYTAGAFFLHYTAAEKDDTYDYDTDFAFADAAGGGGNG